MTRTRRTALCTSLAATALASSVFAQSLPGGFANLAVSATTIDKGTDASIAAGIGYRFSRTIGFGVELTVVPSLKPDVPVIYPATNTVLSGSPLSVVSSSFPTQFVATAVIPDIRIDRPGGHATIFTAHVRLEIPTRSARLVPYLIAGGGVANVTERFRQTIRYTQCPVTALSLSSCVSGPELVSTNSSTSSDFAFTLGGGVSRLFGSHLSIDGDARYIGVTGYRDRNIGRFGAGATYRV